MRSDQLLMRSSVNTFFFYLCIDVHNYTEAVLFAVFKLEKQKREYSMNWKNLFIYKMRDAFLNKS